MNLLFKIFISSLLSKILVSARTNNLDSQSSHARKNQNKAVHRKIQRSMELAHQSSDIQPLILSLNISFVEKSEPRIKVSRFTKTLPRDVDVLVFHEANIQAEDYCTDDGKI